MKTHFFPDCISAYKFVVYSIRNTKCTATWKREHFMLFFSSSFLISPCDVESIKSCTTWHEKRGKKREFSITIWFGFHLKTLFLEWSFNFLLQFCISCGDALKSARFVYIDYSTVCNSAIWFSPPSSNEWSVHEERINFDLIVFSLPSLSPSFSQRSPIAEHKNVMPWPRQRPVVSVFLLQNAVLICTLFRNHRNEKK